MRHSRLTVYCNQALAKAVSPQQPAYTNWVCPRWSLTAIPELATNGGTGRLEVIICPFHNSAKPSRYHQLVLHDPVWYDHLPYVPIPSHWPVFTPKDKLAEWFESYAKLLELNVWT